MVGAIEAVGARVLEVGAEGDGIGRRAVRRKPDDQDVASSRNRRSVDGGRSAGRAVDDAGVALGGVESQRNRPAERLCRGRHIDRRAGTQRDAASRDRRPTRADGQATSQRSTASRNRDTTSSDVKPASSDRSAASSNRQSTRADR